MSEEPEDVPAFPNRFGYGMTLRDYFAGQALAGMCALSDMATVKDEAFAKAAYSLADAMLQERVK